MTQELKDLFGKEEALCDELLEGLVTEEDAEDNGMLQGIYTKFFHQPLTPPAMYAFANKMYASKVEMAKKAWDKEDWTKFISLHEKPYRAEALYECIQNITSDKVYWELAISVFEESENVYQNMIIWNEIFGNEKRREALLKLPEVHGKNNILSASDSNGYIKVYRGYHSNRGQKGISWTLSLEQAEWFANRFQQDDPIIVEALVHMDDIVFYTNNRNEQEVVINDPANVLQGLLEHCA